MQWVMESTGKGVRITYLGGKNGQVARDRVREVSYAELKKNPEILLKSEAKDPFQLHVELAAHTLPAYQQNLHTETDQRTLAVYRTLGEWVLDAQKTEGDYVAQVGSNSVFKLTRSGDTIHILPLTSQLFIVKNRTRTELQPQTALQLSSRDLVGATLVLGQSGWRFGWVLKNPSLANIQRLPTIELGADLQSPWFKKALRYSGVALAALIALSFIWPAQKQDELIPPQMAKIILTPPKHRASGAAESAPAAQTVAQKKVQETAVVQAFRAKALQSAVSGLMKGGMTRLLQQSDFVAGHRQNADASQIFNSQSKDIRATAPQVGELGSKTIAVASLGGNGMPGSTGNGKAIGYGKGEHASVSGQGKGFVSMDLANSSVEEGLTKDEVGEVIHRHLSEVRYCYESAMIRTPDIEGKLIVDFVIGGSGVVKTAEAKSSTLPDPRLDDCIIRRLVTWKFPNTKGGVDVAVSYPFIFKTLGR
jgi:hypothetical protein